MKKRPLELTLLSIIFLGFALYHSYWTYGAVHATDQPWSESLLIEYGVLALSWLLIPLALRASRVLWAVLLLSGANITLHHLESMGIHHVSALGISSLPELWAQTILITSLLLSRPCRVALFHPSRRWWLTPSRKRALLKTRLRPVLGGEILIQTFDISEGGIFIALNASTHWHRTQAKLKQTPENCLQVGAYCWLRITLDEFSSLTCTAEVVRKTTGEQGIYPAGIGLRFVGLSPQDRKVLAKFLGSQSIAQQTVPAPKPEPEAEIQPEIQPEIKLEASSEKEQTASPEQLAA